LPDLAPGESSIALPDGTLARRLRQGGSTFLATTPVTNAQYRRFIEATGWPPPPTWCREEFDRPDAPVTGVTWFEARAYSAWVGGDLPSEEEWEEAASSGGTGIPFATANSKLTQ